MHEVERPLAWAMALAMVLTLALGTLTQQVGEPLAGRPAWGALLAFARGLPDVARATLGRGIYAGNALLLERMRLLEDGLEDDSALTGLLLPRRRPCSPHSGAATTRSTAAAMAGSFTARTSTGSWHPASATPPRWHGERARGARGRLPASPTRSPP